MRINKERIISNEILVPAYNKTILYAERKMAAFKNSGMTSKTSPQDLAHEAVMLTLDGTRTWNKNKTPDLFVHLAGSVRSLISNMYTGSDFEINDRKLDGHEIITATSASENTPEEVLDFESKVSFIIAYIVATNQELKTVAEIIYRDGIHKPQDIAGHLGINVSEVNSKKSALKKLMRHTDFIIYYISKNHKNLAEITAITYIHNVTDNKAISQQLKLPIDRVRLLRTQLDNVVNDIHGGKM